MAGRRPSVHGKHAGEYAKTDENKGVDEDLELGIEGFPFFKERFVDRDNEILDFDSETYLAQLKMKGLSGGFNVFLVTGIQFTRKEFDDKSLESGGFVRTFFQIYVGEQILAAAQ